MFNKIMVWLKKLPDRLLEPAADPRQSSAYTYERQQALLEKLRKATADTKQARLELEFRKATVQATAGEIEKWINQALKAEREDMAQASMQRHKEIEAELSLMESQLEDVRNSEQRLAQLEQRLMTQIEFIFTRQESISQRYSAAETQADINRIMRDISRDLHQLESEFEQAERQTDQMVARAEWLDLAG